MEFFPVIMTRDNLDGIGSYPLTEGFCLRKFKDGDELAWAEVEKATGDFKSIEDALERFNAEFGYDIEGMKSRCFFIEHESGRTVGTATAWYNRDFQGEDYGRVHWVAIMPEFQGRKLAKPMMEAVMRRLAETHKKAYLTTQTTSARAINMYLDLGFVPFIFSPDCKRAWRLLAEELKRPELNNCLTGDNGDK
jgi:ribosomal protein S18 acetylase RimI-like enzyme